MYHSVHDASHHKVVVVQISSRSDFDRIEKNGLLTIHYSKRGQSYQEEKSQVNAMNFEFNTLPSTKPPSDSSESNGVSMMDTNSPNLVSQDEESKLEEDPKPTRPLSAYNFFFQDERRRILERMPVRAEGKPRRSHGKLGFAPMARTVANSWNKLSDEDRQPYEARARREKIRYKRDVAAWKKRQLRLKRAQGQSGGRRDSNEAGKSSEMQGPSVASHQYSLSGQDAYARGMLSIASQADRIVLQLDQQQRLRRNIHLLANVLEEDGVNLLLQIFQP